jgi:hypothetical protein
MSETYIPNIAAIRDCLSRRDFRQLCRELLGWDNDSGEVAVEAAGGQFTLNAVAQKRGFRILHCPQIPDRDIRIKIDNKITATVREHLIIFTDGDEQIWQWTRRQPGRPAASRSFTVGSSQSGEALAQKLAALSFSLDEEESVTITTVAGRAGAAFDVERVTKRFYTQFTAEHAALLKFIQGITEAADLQWYGSLMLNRLMFVYFIQKKGFLDNDVDYLRNRLDRLQQQRGKGKFHTFYRYFLLRLFHDGLGKAPAQRDADLEKLLGHVPYLNGGFFEVHELEQKYPDIDIPDEAFQKLFDFFDHYRWHLDERPCRADNEINPDVVGYIFEKYINQKQMGAYYTKEDITEYISKNTIIPFLFDAARKACPIAFKPDSYLWRLLSEAPDRYIYPAVRKGVVRDDGTLVPESELPDFVQTGMRDPNARMFDKRYNLSQPAKDDSLRLPTETWREYVARRTRCLEIREKLRVGEIHEINDLITLNLDIWQFARDAVSKCEGPELLRAFWNAIREVTVLDPTCGSGAFLFAALRILETIYDDCLGRMEGFASEPVAAKQPEKFTDFRTVLAQMAQHPSEGYFILKSIIINNLFGVDIMPEAVEICKLRLFLKLAAQARTFEQIEPLPDIDFNIRAGNTLVGYATLESLKKSQEGKLLFTAGELAGIERSAIGTARIFTQFKELQISSSSEAQNPPQRSSEPRGSSPRADSELIARTKIAMRQALSRLADRLDLYLAGEYNIDVDNKPAEFAKWKASHQPFHWFTEFYGVMSQGGFDVVIGNPPYLDLKGLISYAVLGFSTLPAKNLYPLVLERCGALSPEGRQGFIVPVSSVATEGYRTLQRYMSRRLLYISSYDDRPSHLFDGLDKNTLSILIVASPPGVHGWYSSRLNRWNVEGRSSLFQLLEFAGTPREELPGCIPKIGTAREYGVWQKLFSSKQRVANSRSPGGEHTVYYSRKVNAFMQVLDFVPDVRNGKGVLRPPSEFKTLQLRTHSEAAAVFCALNSTLFRWFMDVVSDGSHLNRREVDNFPFLPPRSASQLSDPARLAVRLSQRLRDTSEVRVMRYPHDTLTVQCIIAKRAKPIIDEIDRVLAEHYGFTPAELDFIINYDIKYRMGAETEAEDGE